MKYLIMILFLSTIGSTPLLEETQHLQVQEFDIISKEIENFDFKPAEGLNPTHYQYDFLGQKENYSIDEFQRFEDNSTKFDLVIYEFEDSQTAKESLQKARDFQFIDAILKDYNYLFRIDSKLILVKSGCNQTKDKWDDILDNIRNSVNIDEGIICDCGGRCFDK